MFKSDILDKHFQLTSVVQVSVPIFHEEVIDCVLRCVFFFFSMLVNFVRNFILTNIWVPLL